ncbi:hypothetical protein ACLB2K_046333 [Fragaria x ananassa]
MLEQLSMFRDHIKLTLSEVVKTVEFCFQRDNCVIEGLCPKLSSAGGRGRSRKNIKKQRRQEQLDLRNQTKHKHCNIYTDIHGRVGEFVTDHHHWDSL